MGGIKNGWKIAFLKLPRSGFVHHNEKPNISRMQIN
jgi:hypothetical protein